MLKSIKSISKTGNAILGILMMFGLMIFNMVPSLAAPDLEVSGAKKELGPKDEVVALANAPQHPPTEALTPRENSIYQKATPRVGTLSITRLKTHSDDFSRYESLWDGNENENIHHPHPVAGATPLSLRERGWGRGVIYEGVESRESLTPIAAQGANFVVHYNPNGDCQTDGIGFRSFILTGTIKNWPPGSQEAFEHALSIWAMLLDANQTIVINACWVDPGGTNPLGTGQPVSVFADPTDFTGAPVTDTLYPAALANELAGTDLNDADAEIAVAFNGNSGVNWYFGLDANPPGTEKDFVTTALHEIGHGLGFVSTMFVNTAGSNDICETGNPNDGKGCWGLGFDKPIIYDRFLVNSGGDSLINTTLFPNPSLELAAALTGTVYFSGTNAILADADSPPQLYTPPTFSNGSSILHLDNILRYTNSPNRLMTPFAGQPQHHPGPIMLGIFKDMGWQINDLPAAMFDISTSVNTVQAGQALTYTLTITNTGIQTIMNVTITDTVPVSTTLDTNSLNDGGSASGTTPGSLITWISTGANLFTGNALSHTFVVTVSLDGAPAISNTAYVTSSVGFGANATVSTTVTEGGNNVYLPLILRNQN